ncbi:WD and tetratricopeptide repeats protein [Physocladia obscura]|uniref:WD and tetratricopeptide repeats protein n=1 Tax=Physocladia obscura TaxID=109957 RepID=A0AAD5XGS2_9FUNG|nr:WD and tetratricopeptide repeats protein [Physocladia obscura]
MSPFSQLREWVTGEDMKLQVNVARELRAIRPIVCDETVLRVAGSRLLSASAAKRTLALQPVFALVFGLSSNEASVSDSDNSDSLLGHWDAHLALCLLLMAEHSATIVQSNSETIDTANNNKYTNQYAPYIHSLPVKFANPLCLPTAALTRLAGSLVDGIIADEAKQLRLVLEHVLIPANVAFPGILLPLSESEVDSTDDVSDKLWYRFLWAHAAIASRAFSFKLDSEHSEVFMVPFLDIANHSNDPNLVVKGVDPLSKSLVVKARRDIAENELLTIAYHDNAPNYFLLSHYGFALDDNPDETVNVSFDDGNDVDSDSNALALKIRKDALLASCALSLNLGRDHEFGPYIDFNSKINGIDKPKQTHESAGISNSMIQSLRILAANEQDLSNLNESNVSSLIIEPLSQENEDNVFQMIELMAKTLLDMYPTTLQDDLARQAQPDEGGDEKYILVYLIGQKRILASVIDWCQQRK